MTVSNPIQVNNSIRWKLLSTLLGLIVILVVTLTGLEFFLQKKTLENELEHRIELMKENLLERGRSLSNFLLSQVENEVAAFNFSQVQKLLQTSIDESPLLDYAILVNSDGVAFINTLHPELEQEVLREQQDQFALSQENLVYQEYPDSNILEYILPIHFGAKRWGVLRLGFTTALLQHEIAQSRAEIVTIISEMILTTSTIAGLFILLGSGMVLLLSTTLSRPLIRLTESVREVGRGNYDLAAKMMLDSSGLTQRELASQGEIGLLAASFMDMANEVRRSQSALELYNRTLEEKVRDRTLELEHAYEKLKELDELKTSFLSTVSHELRTPLTSVLGFAHIIQKKLDSVLIPALGENTDPKVRKAMRQVMDNTHIIVEEGERLTSLINEVLDLAKMEAGRIEWNMQELSIQDVVARAMSATSSLFVKKTVDFRQDIPPELPLVRGDRDRLIQVVINLISNAVKFTETGSVTCRARFENDAIIVSVVDTGCGIKPDDQPLVFEKFKQVGDTLTDKPKGTGLGLPICKEIIEHHGGSLWVESEPGVGSIFGFTLPLTYSPLSAAATVVSLEGEPVSLVWSTTCLELQGLLQKRIACRQARLPTTPGTVLIIDDDPNIRLLLKQELLAEGYQVIEAGDGEDGLAKAYEVWPDLITLDVRMPAINGFDVAARLHANPATLDIPIILHTVAEDRKLADLLRIDRYLTKPVSDSRLQEEVASLLKRNHRPAHRILVLDSLSERHASWLNLLQAVEHALAITDDSEQCFAFADSFKPDLVIAEARLARDRHIVHRLRIEQGMEHLLFALFEND